MCPPPLSPPPSPPLPLPPLPPGSDRLVTVFFVRVLLSMAESSERPSEGVARRERRLRSWWRHEQQSVAMALSAAAHLSFDKVAAGEKNSGPRAQTTFSAGRPGVLTEPESQGEAFTVCYVPAPVPLLAVPLLAGAAGEAVDARTLSFLLARSLAEKEEEKGAGEGEEGGVCPAGGGVAPGVLGARSGAPWVEEEEEEEEADASDLLLPLSLPRSSSTTAVARSRLVFFSRCAPFLRWQVHAAGLLGRYGPE